MGGLIMRYKNRYQYKGFSSLISDKFKLCLKDEIFNLLDKQTKEIGEENKSLRAELDDTNKELRRIIQIVRRLNKEKMENLKERMEILKND